MTMATMAAMQRGRAAFAHPSGDHLTYLNVFRAYLAVDGDAAWCAAHFVHPRSMRKAVHIRDQLRRILVKRMGVVPQSCGTQTDTVRRCLVAGCFMQVAVLQPRAPVTSSACWRHILLAVGVHHRCRLLLERVGRIAPAAHSGALAASRCGGRVQARVPTHHSAFMHQVWSDAIVAKLQRGSARQRARHSDCATPPW